MKRLILFSILCVQDPAAQSSKDAQEALEKLADAHQRRQEAKFRELIRVDRRFVFKIANAIASINIRAKADGSPTDATFLKDIVSAFGALKDLGEAEIRQLATLKSRADLADRLTKKEAGEWVGVRDRIARAVQKLQNQSDTQAQEDLKAAGAKMEAAFGDRLWQNQADHWLAVSLAQQARYREALEAYDRVIRRSRDLGDLEGELSSLGNSSQVCSQLGDPDEPLARSKRALEIAKLQGDPSAEALQWDNVGSAHVQRGQYREALRAFETSLKLFRELKDPLWPGVLLNNIGRVHSLLGLQADALKLFGQALETARANGARPLEAATLGNIGLAQFELGRYALAIESHSAALEIEKNQPDRSSLATTLGNLAAAKHETGRYEEALEDLDRALEILRELGMRNLEGATLSQKADTLGKLGRAQDALKAFDDALALLRQVGNRGGEAVTLGRWGVALLKQGESSRGLEALRRSIQTVEIIRSEIGMLNAEKAAWLAQFRWLYERTADALLQNKQSEEAFQVIEQMRSRNLLDLVQQGGAGLPPPELTDRKSKAVRLYNAARGELEGRLRLAAGAPQEDREGHQAAVASLKTELSRREEELGAIQHEISIKQPMEESQPLQGPDIQKELRDGEALLVYTVMDAFDRRPDRLESREQILVALVTRSRLRMISIERPRNFQDQVRWFRQAAALSARGYPAREYKKRARVLYGTLIQPIEGWLKEEGVRRLVIAPDELLYGIPWEGLVSSEDGEGYSALEYAGIRFEIEYASSGTLWAKRRTQGAPAGSKLVAFGDPDYGSLAGMPERGPSAAPRWKFETADAPQDLKSLLPSPGDSERRGWGRLPHSAGEVREIGALLQSEVLLQAEASERKAKQIQGARFIHFACHGFIDGDEPMRSALVLTADKENDGYLEAREIADLKLPCELVVLSACDSASGEMLRGEGLIGLARAFMIAGARSVIASLWAVSDEGGKEFMIAFYKKLAAGKDKIAALAETKREFMKHEKYSAPYYWAGFVLHGD